MLRFDGSNGPKISTSKRLQSESKSPRLTDTGARSFRDLVVGQKDLGFVLAVYRFTESFPDGEKVRTGPPDAASRRFGVAGLVS
jgi:hypothetical protein